MDETPLSLFIPESKRESMEWKFSGQISANKLKLSTFHRKSTMLSIFCEKMAFFLLTIWIQKPISIVNTTQNLCKQQEKTKEEQALWSFLLGVDWQHFHITPYSHDLAPSDFYLFTHLKNICVVIYSTLTMIWRELARRWKKCVTAKGSYIEK